MEVGYVPDVPFIIGLHIFFTSIHNIPSMGSTQIGHYLSVFNDTLHTMILGTLHVVLDLTAIVCNEHEIDGDTV